MKKFVAVSVGIAILILARAPLHAATQSGALDAKSQISQGACAPFSTTTPALAAAGKVAQKDKVPSKNPDDQQIGSAMDLFGDFTQVTASSVRMPVRINDGFKNAADYQDYVTHSGQFGRSSSSVQRACAMTTVIPTAGP